MNKSVCDSKFSGDSELSKDRHLRWFLPLITTSDFYADF